MNSSELPKIPLDCGLSLTGEPPLPPEPPQSDLSDETLASVVRSATESSAEDLPGRFDPSDRFTTWTYVLLGLVVFLLASIGVVLLARQLRPLSDRFASDNRLTLSDRIRQLETAKSKEERLEAAQAIVGLGPDAVVAALDDSTEIGEADQSLWICQPAAHSLAEVGEEAVPSLVAALDSRRANVRAGAANVLREMGPPAHDAADRLVAALQDDNRWVRWYALEALGNLGPAAAGALKVLAALLDHEDAYTRRRAVEAIGRLGATAAPVESALIEARDHDPDLGVRRAAVTALHQVNLPRVAAEALEQASAEVQQLAEKLQSDDEFAATAAAKTLGQMGVVAKDAVPSLALALRAKNKWLREAAARALAELDVYAGDATMALEAAARDPEPEVRAAADSALEKIAKARK
ncbi:MAG: HEAT repeat domain-containing protein [Thermoguttaceae bacterium]|jgi:HEAT repeat protein